MHYSFTNTSTLTTPYSELSVGDASELMSFYQYLFNEEYTTHIRRQACCLLDTHILHRTMEVGSDVLMEQGEHYNTYQLSQSTAFALADCVRATYVLACRIANSCEWMKLSVDPRTPFATPDVFSLLYHKGFPTFVPHFEAYHLSSFGKRFCTLDDLHEFAYATQWWVLCMTPFLHALAVHEEVYQEPIPIEAAFMPSPAPTRPSSPPSPQSSLYALDYFVSSAVDCTPHQESAEVPPPPEIPDRVIAWLLGTPAPVWPSIPMPDVAEDPLQGINLDALPPYSTPTASPKRTMTPVYQWQEWSAHGGNVLNSYPAELRRKSPTSSPEASQGSLSTAWSDLEPDQRLLEIIQAYQPNTEVAWESMFKYVRSYETACIPALEEYLSSVPASFVA